MICALPSPHPRSKAPNTDRVRIANRELLAELYDGMEGASEAKRETKTDMSRSAVLARQRAALAESRLAARRAQEAEDAARREAIEARQRAAVEEEARRKEEEFPSRLAAFEAEAQFARDVTANLIRMERTKAHRAEMLHREWEEAVYKPINEQIKEQNDEKAFARRKRDQRKMYEKYLETDKSKHGVYLDIVIEKDYDPFAHKKDALKYSKKAINDPVKRDLQRYDDELAMLDKDDPRRAAKGKADKLGRETLDIKHWGRLESTPHHERKFKPMSSLTQKSTVTMDHYAKPDPAALRAEIPRGKRIVDKPPQGREQPHRGKRIIGQKDSIKLG